MGGAVADWGTGDGGGGGWCGHRKLTSVTIVTWNRQKYKSLGKFLFSEEKCKISFTVKILKFWTPEKNAVGNHPKNWTMWIYHRVMCSHNEDGRANYVDPLWAVWSGSTLITQAYLSKNLRSLWALSSEFVSSSIPSWQILTAHAEPFREARDLAFCLKVPLDSLLVWASSGGSGKTARIRRLAWSFAARIGDKYQIHLKLPIMVYPK